VDLRVERGLVKLLTEKGLTERRACRCMGLCRMSIRYEQKPEKLKGQQIREEIKQLSNRHRRYGTPRMTALLKRRYIVNHKRVERIWREEGLPLPRKRHRRRKLSPSGERLREASRPNEIWCFDFVFDRTEYGQKLKMFAVLDEYTRECLEIRVEKQMRSQDVMETLDELMTERGVPRYMRSDNGAEFIAKELQAWLRSKGVNPIHIEPGSPWENGYIESFNGKFRDECLDQELFWSRGEAQVIADWYRETYNHERPHSSLDYKTPVEFANTNFPIG